MGFIKILKQELELFSNIFDKYKIKKHYSLCGGNVASVVKNNNKLYNFDEDIDFHFHEKYIEEFKKYVVPEALKAGLETQYVWYSNDKLKQVTFKFPNQPKYGVDFNILKNNKNPTSDFYYYSCFIGITVPVEVVKRIPKTCYDDLRKENLEGYNFYIPNNHELYLKYMYKDGWKVPAPKGFAYYKKDFSPAVYALINWEQDVRKEVQ